MFDLLGQDKTMNLLEQTLDIASARHSIIASNLANIDTPGYKAKDIAFKEELKIALQRSLNSDLNNASGSFEYSVSRKPVAFEITNVEPRQDGNTVDLDMELGKLSKTTSTYNKAATIYGMKIKLLRKAMEA